MINEPLSLSLSLVQLHFLDIKMQEKINRTFIQFTVVLLLMPEQSRVNDCLDLLCNFLNAAPSHFPA